MSFQKTFIQQVEEFLRTTEMSAARFGREAAGDPRLVFDLRKGRSCGMKLADRVMAFMRRYRAENAPEVAAE